jgi:hypothetical protein
MNVPTMPKLPLRAALVALLLAASARPAAACSLIGYRGSRDARDTHLVAVPSDRTVSAARGLPRELRRAERPRDWRELMYSPRQRDWWGLQVRKIGRRVRRIFRPRAPFGQVVALERVGGAEDARIRAALARSGGEAVLVRWDLGASCGPVLREERDPWLRPGAQVFLTARLRDPRGWVRGRPTLDVRSFDYPYPMRAMLVRGPMHGERPLPVETYWSLYEALPAGYEPADTAAALARLDAWVRANAAPARHPHARAELDYARGRLLPMAPVVVQAPVSQPSGRGDGTEIENRGSAIRTSTPARNTDGAPGQQEARARQGGQRP